MRISTHPVRERVSGILSATAFGIVVAFSIGVGVTSYKLSVYWFETNKFEEQVTALRLVDAFVANYSDLRGAQLDSGAPVPATFRAAARYVGIVVLLAAVALGATAVSGSLFAGIMVPGSLFIGGIGALVRTYQVWRGYGAWRIWHAASWVLLGLSMFFLGVPLSVNQ